MLKELSISKFDFFVHLSDDDGKLTFWEENELEQVLDNQSV